MNESKATEVVRIILVILVTIWCMILFIFSSQDGVQSSKVSRKVVITVLEIRDSLSNSKNDAKIQEDIEVVNSLPKLQGENSSKYSEETIQKWDKIIRKLAHFILFAIGGFLIFMLVVSFDADVRITIQKFLLSSVSGIIIAALDEFHQKFSVGRSSEYRDIFLDSSGVITGVVIGIVMMFLLNKLVDLIYYIKDGKEKKRILTHISEIEEEYMDEQEINNEKDKEK